MLHFASSATPKSRATASHAGSQLLLAAGSPRCKHRRVPQMTLAAGRRSQKSRAGRGRQQSIAGSTQRAGHAAASLLLAQPLHLLPARAFTFCLFPMGSAFKQPPPFLDSPHRPPQRPLAVSPRQSRLITKLSNGTCRNAASRRKAFSSHRCQPSRLLPASRKTYYCC